MSNALGSSRMELGKEYNYEGHPCMVKLENPHADSRELYRFGFYRNGKRLFGIYKRHDNLGFITQNIFDGYEMSRKFGKYPITKHDIKMEKLRAEE